MWHSVAQKAMEPQDVHVFQGKQLAELVEAIDFLSISAGSSPVLFNMNAKSRPEQLRKWLNA